jgi:hypothetical protein
MKRGLEKCMNEWIGIRKGICKEKPRKRRKNNEKNRSEEVESEVGG